MKCFRIMSEDRMDIDISFKEQDFGSLFWYKNKKIHKFISFKKAKKELFNFYLIKAPETLALNLLYNDDIIESIVNIKTNKRIKSFNVWDIIEEILPKKIKNIKNIIKESNSDEEILEKLENLIKEA